MITIIVAFLTGVAGPMLVVLIKHYLDKRHHNIDLVKSNLEVSKQIIDKIEHIKEEFNADRVWIAQFHNGGHFYPTGKSIAKFSVFYETVSPETESVQTSLQNIPVNLFSKSMNELLEKDVIQITDYKDETVPTYGLKYIAETHGNKSSYLFAIKSIENKFIGYLVVDFTKRKTKLDVNSIAHISNHAYAIGGVLIHN
jgi:hypothetical protein